MSMFNADQEAHMRDMAALPAEKKCACGWNVRGDCFGSCRGDEAKGGFVHCAHAQPGGRRTCDLRKGHTEDHHSHGRSQGTGWVTDRVSWPSHRRGVLDCTDPSHKESV